MLKIGEVIFSNTQDAKLFVEDTKSIPHDNKLFLRKQTVCGIKIKVKQNTLKRTDNVVNIPP